LLWAIRRLLLIGYLIGKLSLFQFLVKTYPVINVIPDIREVAGQLLRLKSPVASLCCIAGVVSAAISLLLQS